MHIHVLTDSGEAKFWLEPSVEMAMSKGISAQDLKGIAEQIKERTDEIKDAWKKHFGS
jgi:3-methyladenine DNA glycosylase AlkD